MAQACSAPRLSEFKSWLAKRFVSSEATTGEVLRTKIMYSNKRKDVAPTPFFFLLSSFVCFSSLVFIFWGNRRHKQVSEKTCNFQSVGQDVYSFVKKQQWLKPSQHKARYSMGLCVWRFHQPKRISSFEAPQNEPLTGQAARSELRCGPRVGARNSGYHLKFKIRKLVSSRKLISKIGTWNFQIFFFSAGFFPPLGMGYDGGHRDHFVQAQSHSFYSVERINRNL